VRNGGYLDRDIDFVALADKGPISIWRVILAFVLTPLLISLALASAMPFYNGLPNYMDRVLRTWPLYVIFGALPPTILFGVPTFLILRKLARLSLVNCAAVGAIIITVPWFFLFLFPTGSAWTGDRATIINGEYTAYGWLEFAQTMLIFAAAGAVGGAIFWMIAAAKWPRRQT
jgi:hypothetical protein